MENSRSTTPEIDYTLFGLFFIMQCNFQVLRPGGSYNIRIWWRSGDKSNIWRIGRVSMWSSTYDYQALFEGLVGNSFRGDIAIDDVKFLDGKCPPPG